MPPDGRPGAGDAVRGDAARARRRAFLPPSVQKLLMMVCGLLLAGWLLRELGEGVFDKGWIDHFVRGQGLAGEGLFLLVGAAAVSVGLPRQAVAFLGGYAFGSWTGVGLAMVAQMLGCVVSFGWARMVGGSWVRQRLSGSFGRRLSRLTTMLQQDGFGATLALRLLPVGNNLLLNLLAGLCGVPVLGFMAGTLVGYLPQTVVFVLLGDGIALDHRAQLALAAILLVLSVLLGFWLMRRTQAARTLEEAAEAPAQQPADRTKSSR